MFQLTLQLNTSSSSTFLAAKSLCTNDFLERHFIPAAICFENRKNVLSNSLEFCCLSKHKRIITKNLKGYCLHTID